MDLHTDIKDLFKKQKEVYPQKRYLNLYYKEDKTTLPATIALYVVFVLVIVLALFKIFVFDYAYKLSQLENEVTYQNQQIEQKQNDLSDYDKVYNDYIRYSATETEQNTINRIEILDLIDTNIRPFAVINNVTIEDDSVLIEFSGTDLSKVAEITANIEKSPLVSYTLVDTAISTEDNKNVVNANIFIELKTSELKDSEDENE